RYFSMAKNKMTTGMTATSDVANKYCHCTSNLPKKAWMPTVNGLDSSEEIIVKATTNSFQAITKTKITVVMIPGTAKGKTTFRSAWNFVQPSIQAACSSSRGMVEK